MSLIHFTIDLVEGDPKLDRFLLYQITSTSFTGRGEQIELGKARVDREIQRYIFEPSEDWKKSKAFIPHWFFDDEYQETGIPSWEGTGYYCGAWSYLIHRRMIRIIDRPCSLEEDLD